MLVPVVKKLRKIALLMCADMSDTQQYPYTNPGKDYPSDLGDDIWPGGFENNKENEPASKKDDEKHKWDLHYIGPGPTQNDQVTYGERPTYMVDPESPKTNAQSEVQDVIKSKGDDPNELDRETWVGEGVIDSFNF